MPKINPKIAPTAKLASITKETSDKIFPQFLPSFIENKMINTNPSDIKMPMITKLVSAKRDDSLSEGFPFPDLLLSFSICGQLGDLQCKIYKRVNCLNIYNLRNLGLISNKLCI
jgi:hypothetical protein